MMSSVGISYREKDANGWTVMAQWAGGKTTCSESENHFVSWLFSSGATLALSNGSRHECTAGAWTAESHINYTWTDQSQSTQNIDDIDTNWSEQVRGR